MNMVQAKAALASRGLTAINCYVRDFQDCVVSGVRPLPDGTDERYEGSGIDWDAAITALDCNGPTVTPSKAVVDAAAESALFG